MELWDAGVEPSLQGLCCRRTWISQSPAIRALGRCFILEGRIFLMSHGRLGKFLTFVSLSVRLGNISVDFSLSNSNMPFCGYPNRIKLLRVRLPYWLNVSPSLFFLLPLPLFRPTLSSSPSRSFYLCPTLSISLSLSPSLTVSPSLSLPLPLAVWAVGRPALRSLSALIVSWAPCQRGSRRKLLEELERIY